MEEKTSSNKATSRISSEEGWKKTSLKVCAPARLTGFELELKLMEPSTNEIMGCFPSRLPPKSLKNRNMKSKKPKDSTRRREGGRRESVKVKTNLCLLKFKILCDFISPRPVDVFIRVEFFFQLRQLVCREVCPVGAILVDDFLLWYCNIQFL